MSIARWGNPMPSVGGRRRAGDFTAADEKDGEKS